MTDTIKPPMSLDTEQHLIGAVMRGGRQTFEKVKDVITPDMFWSDSHKSVWRGIEKIYDNGMQLDVIIIGDEMERMLKIGEIEQEWGNGVRSGRAFLSDLRKDGDPRNVETYAEQVQDYHIKRELLGFIPTWGYWSANGRRGKDIVADIMSNLSKIEIYGANDEYTVPISKGVSDAYDWTNKAASGELVGVPTGLMDLDKIIKSMIKGNLYLLAGRPGMGKTALLLTIAHYVAKTLKMHVGIFSLEMSTMQVAQRLISIESGIALDAIMHGSLKEHEWPTYTHAVEVVADLPITINDLSSINVSQIRQTARRMKSADGLDLIIVDYIQLAGSDGKRYENRNLEVSATSRGLKYLSRELDVPILAAAQLSRAVEQRQSKKPILSDLRESGSLEQDAYSVWFLWDDESEVKQNIVQVNVAKHRNGPVGDCELYFHKHLSKFGNAQTKIFKID